MLNVLNVLALSECSYAECTNSEYCTAKCYYAECTHIVCCSAECQYAEDIILSVVMLNVIMLRILH